MIARMRHTTEICIQIYSNYENKAHKKQRKNGNLYSPPGHDH